MIELCMGGSFAFCTFTPWLGRRVDIYTAIDRYIGLALAMSSSMAIGMLCLDFFLLSIDLSDWILHRPQFRHHKKGTRLRSPATTPAPARPTCSNIQPNRTSTDILASI